MVALLAYPSPPAPRVERTPVPSMCTHHARAVAKFFRGRLFRTADVVREFGWPEAHAQRVMREAVYTDLVVSHGSFYRAPKQ